MVWILSGIAHLTQAWSENTGARRFGPSLASPIKLTLNRRFKIRQMCFWETIFAVSSYLWHSDLYSEIVKKKQQQQQP